MHQENSPAGFVATDTNPVRLYLPVPSVSCIHLPTSTELLGSTSFGVAPLSSAQLGSPLPSVARMQCALFDVHRSSSTMVAKW